MIISVGYRVNSKRGVRFHFQTWRGANKKYYQGLKGKGFIKCYLENLLLT